LGEEKNAAAPPAELSSFYFCFCLICRFFFHSKFRFFFAWHLKKLEAFRYMSIFFFLFWNSSCPSPPNPTEYKREKAKREDCNPVTFY
jgi:hypothetical protein